MANPHDRLDQAHYGLLLMTAVFVVMALLAAAMVTTHRDFLQTTQISIRQLNLDTLALFPSGRVWRDDAYAHPAVDLRHNSQLPLFGFFPEDLLSGALKPGQRGTPE